MFSESSSISSKNLSIVLDIIKDHLWKEFGRCVNIPESELDRIWSQYSSVRERKHAVIDLFISQHPAPSWTLVAHALYEIGGRYGNSVSCLKSLDLLQQLFPTGTLYILHFLWVYTILSVLVVNPRCACAARVTVVGYVCLLLYISILECVFVSKTILPT